MDAFGLSATHTLAMEIVKAIRGIAGRIIAGHWDQHTRPTKHAIPRAHALQQRFFVCAGHH